MEDSRNIIKAIDALTLKAGGEVVDSKNITEAIDNLKAVFNQEAIGIDDTLTQEGLAADAKAAGDLIKTTSVNLTAYDARVVDADDRDSDRSVGYASGNVRTLSIYVKLVKTLTKEQTSIISLPTAFVPSRNIVGFIYNVTKDAIYPCQISYSGNVNVYHNGNIAVDDKLYGLYTYIK